MTAGEAIKKALLLINAVDRFGEPSENEYSDGLVSLNQLLRRLGVDRLGIHTTAVVTHTLSVGGYDETIGPTGQIVTTRPHKVLSARVTIDGQEYCLTELTRTEYDKIADKNLAGTPEYYFYDPTATNGTLWLYPAPDAALVMSLTLQQPLTEYTSISTTIALPPEYISHIPWALAIDIAPEYGAEAPQSVQGRALETLRQLKRLHSIPTSTLNTDPFNPCGKQPFDILTGE